MARKRKERAPEVAPVVPELGEGGSVVLIFESEHTHRGLKYMPGDILQVHAEEAELIRRFAKTR